MLYRVRLVLESINTRDGEIVPYTDRTIDSADIPPATDRRAEATDLFERVLTLLETALKG